jgi:hypothetical protein
MPMIPIRRGMELYGPVIRPEREVRMKIGGDFFKILNFAVAIMRLFAQIFGDTEDKKEVAESKKRSASSDPDEVC